MKKTRFITTMLLVLFTGIMLAQKDIEIDYRDFSKLDAVSKAAVKKIKAADEIYATNSPDKYKLALPLYLEIYDEDLGYDPLDWRIAMCFLHSEDKPQALNHILRCDESVSKLYHFYLAKAYHFDGQFQKAKDSYTHFSAQIEEADKKMFYSTFDVKSKDYDFAEVMQKLTDACDVGINNSNDSIPVVFENIKIINTKNDEYYPMLHPDGTLIYSSNKSLVPNVKTSNFQIFGAACDSMLIVGFPKASDRYPFDEDDNTIALPFSEYSEGLLYQSMVSDGGDIMMTYTKGKKVKGQPVPRINSSSKEGVACFVDSGTIVFSSDRASKDGENDLYIAFQDLKGKWSKPVLIGGAINTSAHEEIVTYYDNQLYFITNGVGGIGGYDIYKVPYLGANNWGEIKNLGYPINTADNDMGYYPVDDFNGFYCGVRPGGVGGVDIYNVTYDTLGIVDTTLIDTITVDSVDLDLMRQDTVLFLSDSILTDSLPSLTEVDSTFVLPVDTALVNDVLNEGTVDTTLVNGVLDEDDVDFPIEESDSTLSIE